MTVTRALGMRLVWLIVLAASLAQVPTANAADDFDSLYGKIEAANRNGSGAITLSGDIFLGGALPPIRGIIIVDGAGHTITGVGLHRIFDVDGGGLTLADLTLAAGKAPDGESGGAVRLRNGASLIANGVSFNTSRASSGGAIAMSNASDRLSANNSAFLGNAAADRGGALLVAGGQAVITGSAFLDNIAENSGGAIEAAGGRLTITNSTLDNNEAARGGALAASGGITLLTHLTFSRNLAFDGGDALSKRGGTLGMRNSIVVGRGAGSDCQGELDENTGNFIADGSCSPALRGSALLGDLIGQPAYRPLQDDSPAINAAAPEFCAATDQAGTARPQGASCDIGAIESTAIQAETGPQPPPACTLHDQILAANRDQPSGGCPAGRGRDIIIFSKDITLAADLPPITSAITFEGAGFGISGDQKFRIFDIAGGDVIINNLTLKQGSSPHDNGGAIKLHAGARLTVNNAVFQDNAAGWGGAIATTSPNVRLNINSSSFSRNAANNHGEASLTRDESAIITHAGGAIKINGGVVEIANSSFQQNRADFSGGAVEAFQGTVSITNSSFRQNTARDSSGGAIYVGDGVTTLTHLTLLDNNAYRGGGLYQSWGQLRLRNSIIAGSKGGDCAGRLSQNSGNLIEDGSCAPALRGDPALEDPVGSPFLLPLGAASAALLAADARFCTAADQAGRARPQAGPCDIGAFQSVPVERALSACSVTTTHQLNFRAGPGGDRMGLVPARTTLAAAARTLGWFQADYEGVAGWISADYVVKDGNCD